MTTPSPECHDLVVIGGGAAGYFAAIAAAEALSPRAKILLLEKGSQVLQKVKISGGGRCNVTHDCLLPKPLVKNYPRGEKSLLGPFHHFGPSDTIEWFERHGVRLKTEADGRMFPTTNTSQTIIDCLTAAAETAGVRTRTRTGIDAITPTAEGFTLTPTTGDPIHTANLIIATGGTRAASAANLAASLGHTLAPAIPSLFTFKISDDRRISGLQGLSVPQATSSVVGTKLTATGPLLITHWGLSGPAILKLSAWGARDLHQLGYRFDLRINWLPGTDALETINTARAETPKRQIGKHSPFPDLPKRLWSSLLAHAKIPETTQYSQLPKTATRALATEINAGIYNVTGKSTNKDEFVTCGGVSLKEISPKTFASRLHKNLHFAGEILDIDGITGGFNFQNAWTSGHLAGTAVAESIQSELKQRA